MKNMNEFCYCDCPFSTCDNAMEAPHGDKWYCTLKTREDAMSDLMKKANEKFPLGMLYSSFGRECQVKGELRFQDPNCKPIDAIITDGWGGAVFSFGCWSTSWWIDPISN